MLLYAGKNQASHLWLARAVRRRPQVRNACAACRERLYHRRRTTPNSLLLSMRCCLLLHAEVTQAVELLSD